MFGGKETVVILHVKINDVGLVYVADYHLQMYFKIEIPSGTCLGTGGVGRVVHAGEKTLLPSCGPEK